MLVVLIAVVACGPRIGVDYAAFRGDFDNPCGTDPHTGEALTCAAGSTCLDPDEGICRSPVPCTLDPGEPYAPNGEGPTPCGDSPERGCWIGDLCDGGVCIGSRSVCIANTSFPPP